MKHIILIILFSIQSASAVTLLWDSNPPSDNVSGYKAYVGPSSRNYTEVFDVGNLTTFRLDRHFVPGVRTWFAVTAYRNDPDGVLESDYSEEVYFEIPIKIKINRTGEITGEVTPNFNWLLEGTADFQTWLGVDIQFANSENISFQKPFDEDMKFFRLKRMPLDPLLAQASAQMEKGLLLQMADATLITKETTARKLKKFFRYKRRFNSDPRKGAELLIQKPISKVPAQGLPMPPALPVLR